MATNTHGYVNPMHVCATDVDAYNEVGICATDIDNGTLLTLGAITTTSGAVSGFQHTVTVPAANATGLYLACTPPVGVTIDTNIYNDPRYFYNVAGQPIHLDYLQPQTDVIEVEVNCYATGTDPTTVPANVYASVNTSGKLVGATSAPASGTYFTLEGTSTTAIGQNNVTTYILRCARN